MGENWLANEKAEESICWFEGSFVFLTAKKISKCIDGIIEWRVLIYSAYLVPSKQKYKSPSPLCWVHTLVCSGAVSETGGVTALTLRTEQQRSTRFILGLSLLSRRLQHIQWEEIRRTATRRRGKNNFSVSQFPFFFFLSPT